MSLETQSTCCYALPEVWTKAPDVADGKTRQFWRIRQPLAWLINLHLSLMHLNRNKLQYYLRGMRTKEPIALAF